MLFVHFYSTGMTFSELISNVLGHLRLIETRLNSVIHIIGGNYGKGLLLL